MATSTTPARILIVDDQPANYRLLEFILVNAGYSDLCFTANSLAVAELAADVQPDLILLDWNMPDLDGAGVLAQLQPYIASDVYLPVLVLTGDLSLETRQRALSGGAKDFLTKPFDRTEALLRIGNLLETRRLHLRLREQNITLEQRVNERTQQLDSARIEAIERLAYAAEFRDDDTGQHTQRVGQMAAWVATKLGLPNDEIALLRRAAPLHDVGKIGIPDAILLKPGRLTVEEFVVMKNHTTIGGRILSQSESPLFQMAEQVALTHHENWDGTGYPRGLAGESIPIVGRIVSVTDVFDALTHDRPYKTAWPSAQALSEICSLSAKKFDPNVVSAFIHMFDPQGGNDEIPVLTNVIADSSVGAYCSENHQSNMQ